MSELEIRPLQASDEAEWRRLWEDTRRRQAREEATIIHRWSPEAEHCA